MKIKSKITGKEYDPDPKNVIYCKNLTQAGAYCNNNGEIDVLDIIYENVEHKFVFVFEKNEHTKKLYSMWNNRELNY